MLLEVVMFVPGQMLLDDSDLVIVEPLVIETLLWLA